MPLQGISQQLLESLTPSVFDTLQEERGQEQALAQGDQKTQLGQQKLDANIMKLAQGELNNKAQMANSLLIFDNPESLRNNLIKQIQGLEANPIPGVEVEGLIEILNELGEENGFAKIRKGLESDLARVADISGRLNKAASPKSFAPVIDPKTGQLGVPIFDPSTGKASFQIIEGAPIQQTPEQIRLAGIKTKQTESDIEVRETEQKEQIRQRVSRVAELKKEFGDRRRNSARSNRVISEALTLVSQADQGLTGVAKLKLSKLLPGIDASNEAALDSVMKQLALEQLQNFKGPTTDFEFGVTESIVGGIGNSKESNTARLNSLKRAAWFNNRESQQFDKHIKSGGDPETFSFNFGEPINTKKGVFTLQDIQDTAVQKNLSIEEIIKRLNS